MGFSNSLPPTGPWLGLLLRAVVPCLLVGACAGTTPGQIDLMPAPEAYREGLLDPLPEVRPFDEIPYDGILYATDRAPATESDEERYYRNERGYVVRVGLAEIQIGEEETTWEETRELSVEKPRSEAVPLRISGVEEWGTLDATLPVWLDRGLLDPGELPADATARFADAINAQLAASDRKHIYLYVHGYRVPYENPILVSAELWHFLGYRGAFVAYSWPSTPLKHAYVKDSDTSAGFSRNFRLLLEFLAEHTDAEQVHIIGFSNGTRLVTRALDQLALIHGGGSGVEVWKKFRIGHVVLTGSDLDRGVFSSYLSDGILNVSRHMTIYMSRHDKSLGLSQLLTQKKRLGQAWGDQDDEMHALIRKAVDEMRDKLTMINVSDAEGASSGKGHAYFLSSPLVSSDIMVMLDHDLNAAQRGLERQPGVPVYSFPDDYLDRLVRAVASSSEL